jgi:predicted DNA repair protein MutK
MLWVGGSIIVHGLEVTHVWAGPYDTIHDWAVAAGEAVSERFAGLAEWAVTALADGVLGLVLGFVLIPIVTRVIGPVFAALSGKNGHGAH